MNRVQSGLFALRTSAVLALGLSWACSAKEAASAPKTDLHSYRYDHVETTGLTDEVLLPDGTLQRIQFARESSQQELAALRGVAGCGLFGDTPEQRLFLVGELRKDVLRTPEAPDRAAPEAYREFVLSTWYLEAPFSVPLSFGTGDLESLGHSRQDTSIRHACPTIAAHGDLDRFVRVRAK